MLDLTSLNKAVSSLDRAVTLVQMKERDVNCGLDEFEVIRAGVIQNFEFTYELCWKFMKRWVDLNVGNDLLDGVPRIEFYRIMAQQRLIDDVTLWMTFHRARNQTSHIYDEKTSDEVFNVCKLFLPEAKKVQRELERLKIREELILFEVKDLIDEYA